MENIADIASLAFVGHKAASAQGDKIDSLNATKLEALIKNPQPIMVCSSLGLPSNVKAKIFDLMELWAFIHPAQHCVPTIKGLAGFLNVEIDENAEAGAKFIHQAAKILLAQLREVKDEKAFPIAQMMNSAGWVWGELVLSNLSKSSKPTNSSLASFAKLVGTLPQWRQPKIEERDRVENSSADLVKATQILQNALGEGVEIRVGQSDYMEKIAQLFLPTKEKKTLAPKIMLAQADTGIGKTLGYLVPAFLTAKETKQPIWVTTYTRALQTQIARESKKLPHHKMSIRKGRENYLCLLNFEEALAQSNNKILAGMVARWVSVSDDGDIRSGDFPSWLAQNLSQRRWIASLTDSRETCIHNACRHYRNCFIEHQRVASIDADIVIANHAFVLSHSLLANEDEDEDKEAVNYIFDEGHHIFSAADSAFSFHLTGQEMARLRHWLIGNVGGTGAVTGNFFRKNRFAEQGLIARIDEICQKHPHIRALIEETSNLARFLPQIGWRERIALGQPISVAENFLLDLRKLVLESITKKDEGYGLETEPEPLKAAKPLEDAFVELQKSMEVLLSALIVIDDNALISVVRVLKNWTKNQLLVWIKMCQRAQQQNGLVQWVDRYIIDRNEGRELDIGMTRHALDPGKFFAQNILAKSQATLITSASLLAQPQNDDGTNMNWKNADWQMGASHLPAPPHHIYVPTPFDYKKLAKIIIITDIAKNDSAKAEAMAQLFSASNGGALGLWTAVRREVFSYPIIKRKLAKEGLVLLSQHQDGLALADLVDIFRQEENSCLIGTDALRDGMDVPGNALRLIVFDRMPWARPDILHRARRSLFAPNFYDDMIVSLRLQQAFGRLIRKKDDKGVFVLLDARFPSRLKSAFPENVEIERMPLAQSLDKIKCFYES